jgi:hypothetical protein
VQGYQTKEIYSGARKKASPKEIFSTRIRIGQGRDRECKKKGYSEKIENYGELILDASCTPGDISYPREFVVIRIGVSNKFIAL